MDSQENARKGKVRTNGRGSSLKRRGGLRLVWLGLAWRGLAGINSYGVWRTVDGGCGGDRIVMSLNFNVELNPGLESGEKFVACQKFFFCYCQRANTPFNINNLIL